jgi:hypothetical protein
MDDYFLTYDLTKGDTLEDVYEGIDGLLKNKEKCLEMKHKLKSFYKEIYLTDRTHLHDFGDTKLTGLMGFGDFFAAKVIEIIENDFVLKDNKLFCDKVFEIKNKAYEKD